MELTDIKKEPEEAGTGAQSERTKNAQHTPEAPPPSEAPNEAPNDDDNDPPEPPRFLTARALLCSWAWVIFLVILLLFGGCGIVFWYYAIQNRAGLGRWIVWYAILWATVLFAISCYFAIFLKRAFKGEITEKPMERPKKSSWKIVNFARECGLNGKYYLIRSYVTEFMEIVYQTINYSIFACSMAPEYLFFYGFFIAVEGAYRIYGGRLNWKETIKEKDKTRELITDLVSDTFNLLFPPLVMWRVSKIIFKEEELMLITAGPMACVVMKLVLAFQAVLIDVLYKIGNRQRERQRRGTTIDDRTNKVEELQNKYCDLKLRKLLLVASVVVVVFFSLLSSVQLVNYLLNQEQPIHYQRYCSVNAPMCDRWFGYKENCIHIENWDRTPANNDAALKLFSEATATQTIEWSGLQDSGILDGNFPRLRFLNLYKTNATSIPSVTQWKYFHKLRITHAPYLEEIKDFDEGTIRIFYVFWAPELVISKLDIPDATALRLGGLKAIPPYIGAGPPLAVLALSDMNLTQLPDFPKGLKKNILPFRELFLSGNRLSTVEAKFGEEKHELWSTLITDFRGNEIRKYGSPIPEHAFAHGNIVCLNGFDCRPNCNALCPNKYYAKNDIIEEDFCVLECLDLEGCGVSEACKRHFKEL